MFVCLQVQNREIDHAIGDVEEVTKDFAAIKINPSLNVKLSRIVLRCDLCRSWKLSSRFSNTLQKKNMQYFWCDCCYQDYKTQYALAMTAIQQKPLFTIEELDGDPACD